MVSKGACALVGIGLMVFVVATLIIILIATNVIDTRRSITFGSTPTDSNVSPGSDYTSTQITVVKSNNDDKSAKNVSITLLNSPDWLQLTDDNEITGTVPEFDTGGNPTNEYSVTIQANYEKKSKSDTRIEHTFILTVVGPITVDTLAFETSLPDVTIDFGADFKSEEIKLVGGQSASNVTLALIEPNDGTLVINNGHIEWTAPEFEGDFTTLTLNSLSVQFSATDGVDTITQDFSITVAFPELKEVEWDPLESSSTQAAASGSAATEEVAINSGTVTKPLNESIAWAISKYPLPSGLKAAIVEFEINDNKSNTANYSQEFGFDLIGGNISKALSRDIVSGAGGDKNVLTSSNCDRTGFVFLNAVSSTSKRVQYIRSRAIGTTGAGSGVTYNTTDLASTFVNRKIAFHIYDFKIQEVIVEGSSVAAYTNGTLFDLGDLASNDWYLTIRDVKDDIGFLDVTGKVALLE